MKNAKFGLGRRIAVVLGALALTATGAAAAQAADPSAGNIDPDTATSLVIHKHSGLEGERGDGNPTTIDTSKNPALDGVEFTVTPVTAKDGDAIDLDTPEGWDLIDGATAVEVTAGNGYSFGTPVAKTTANGGLASFDLPHGLYKVSETKAPANVASRSADFLVTLPLANDKVAGGWIYDVNVYPKNSVVNPTKEVAAPEVPVIGNDIVWTINADVPVMNEGDTRSSFIVTDTLDDRLDFTSVSIDGMSEGTDYTVTQDGQKVTITFNDPASLESGTLPIELTTTVASLGDGVIENQATQFTNDPDQEGEGVPTNTPKTNWGVLEVLKHAAGDKAKTLSGAEFAVYSDASATTKVGEFTTDENGHGTITLWAGNNDVTEKTYWIKETKAPAGYVLDDSVREVTIVAGATASQTYEIANTQKDHPTLPLTGANGQMLAIIVGSALVLLAAGSALVISRRRKTQA
jgi:fimbrial isopeptide formation D2 family protein/LPXTG-motif cell wall-anchored protein